MRISLARLARTLLLALAATLALAAPAAAQKGPVSTTSSAAFDINQLNAEVRAAVLQARAAEARAVAAAARAREAAAAGETAAQSARYGAIGYRINQHRDDPQQRVYLGAWSGAAAHGYGLIDFGAGDFAGDRYAGEFVDGSFVGAGVYTWADNANNVNNVGMRHEGDFANDRANGPGVFYFTSGSRYAGDNREWRSTGHGVLHRPDGSRYEGAWNTDQRNGLGVEWDAAGRILEQGVFTNDELTSALTQ